MAKSICFHFLVHQPTKLRLYRFFDIGKDSHYYDDFANRTILRRVVQKCYIPMNSLLLGLIKQYNGNFKVSFSISGSALEQFERYAPEVIDSFRRLADTGFVEFLGETYFHSLSSLASPAEFTHQVLRHKDAMKELFGVVPTAFNNTELIYNNSIASMVADLGFKTILTEGARHIMGWRSPNAIYAAGGRPGVKLLLRNYALSEDIARRFSDRSWAAWPLTAEKYLDWLKGAVQNEGNVLNLAMSYDVFGEIHKSQSGIFEFFSALVGDIIGDNTFAFKTPGEVVKRARAVAELDVPETISWTDEEKDVTAWLGNELQQDAYNKLYEQYEKLALLNDEGLWEDYGRLQESDHFYYMSTKFFSDGEGRRGFNPYDTPYEAFINYMNALSDFEIRVDDKIASLAATPAPAVPKAPATKSVAAKKTSTKKKTK